MSKTPKPKGRLAHEGHHCRVDEHWRLDYVKACCNLPWSKYYQKVLRVESFEQDTCDICGAPVLINDHGLAVCIGKCSTVHNEGNPHPERVRQRPTPEEARLIGLSKFIGECCKASL